MNPPSLMIWAAAFGSLVTAGVWILFLSGRPRVPRLSEALQLLEGRAEQSAHPPADVGDGLGGWVYRRFGLPVRDSQRRRLRLKGSTIAEFYTEKSLLALVGLLLPGLVGGAFTLLTGLPWFVPVVAAPAGALLGFFVPDVLLVRGSGSARQDAGEALFTFFDLITLERLANQSATQALHSAAALSDHVLFLQLRGALDRARLQQRTPYANLRALADELGLPALGDVADVMQLDEQGASLTGALRARVKELRDAHLSAAVIAAQEVSERMTVFMVLPALVFGLIFLVPPVLRLIQ